MPADDKDKLEQTEKKPSQPSSPLIFISHDSRDADLAEAFTKLLRSVSAGMLKFFRSSDKEGMEGIEFGEEWYKRLMTKLDSASDVVCLLTERSLERPWILYEAGVAKGKLDTPVLGVALGVPLSKVSSGPFYQFQNCDDSEKALIGLVKQLTRRIPSLEPDDDVVKLQVQIFNTKANKIISRSAVPGTEAEDETPSEGATAKLFEELKVMFRDLPSRVEDRLADNVGINRRRKTRRISPGMIGEIMNTVGNKDEPFTILVIASLIRDDAPWLYEIAMEAFRALKSGTQKDIKQFKQSLRFLEEFIMHRPFFQEFGIIESKEMYLFIEELFQVLHHMTTRRLN